MVCKKKQIQEIILYDFFYKMYLYNHAENKYLAPTKNNSGCLIPFTPLRSSSVLHWLAVLMVSV